MKTIKGWLVMIICLSAFFGFILSVQVVTAAEVKSQVGITFLEGNPTVESTESGKETTKPSVPKNQEKLPQTGEKLRGWQSLLGTFLLLLIGIVGYTRRILVTKTESEPRI